MILHHPVTVPAKASRVMPLRPSSCTFSVHRFSGSRLGYIMLTYIGVRTTMTKGSLRKHEALLIQ